MAAEHASRGHSTWVSYLDSLPSEPWDVLTDKSRPPKAAVVTVAPALPFMSKQPTAMANVSLSLSAAHSPKGRCNIPGMPIGGASAGDSGSDSGVDEEAWMVGLGLALAALDRGRDEVWICDRTKEDVGDLPVCLPVGKFSQSSIAELQSHFSQERAKVRSLKQALADASVTRVKDCCQVAVGRFDHQSTAASGAYDFFLNLDGKGASHLHYREDLYDGSTAAFISRHVVEVVSAFSSWPHTKVSDAAALMLSEDEEQMVLHSWNDTKAAFEESCVNELFERCARGSYCHSVAVVAADGSTWTYQQLDAAAEQISRALCSTTTKDGDRAALLVDRSPALLAAVYGILRAGLSYVPLDLEWPSDRQVVIIEDVQAAAIVLTDDLTAPTLTTPIPQLMLHCGPALSVPQAFQVSLQGVPSVAAVAARQPVLSPDLSAYILYTSGTTGKPKGVDVPHLGLVGRTEWLQHTWPLGEGDAVAHKTPATFAISEWEIFWPLCYGAKVVLAAPRLHGDAQHVASLMEQQKVSHAVFVPSLLDQLLDELDGKQLPALRVILACGEALKPTLAKSCLSLLPSTELVNLYGPTEGTMTVVRFPAEPEEKLFLRSPVGVPIENTQIIVARTGPPNLDPAPVLCQGEVVFGGPLIARGYWRLPELNKEKFVDNPHFPSTPNDLTPPKAYLSGDLGRWRSDGTLEFLGRADNQVKFNGVRIELGEIESSATLLTGVRAAVAFLAGPHLVVACTLTDGDAGAGQADSEPQRLRILAGLREILPKDRVPTRVEVLAVMPTTDRGKVDRKKILEGHLKNEAARATLPPAALAGGAEDQDGLSPTETTIHNLMQELLQVREPLPATARFQDLGFSSLLLGKLTTKIRRGLALPGLPATAVYRSPSLRQLAALVDEEKRSEAEAGAGGGALSTLLVPATFTWKGEESTSLRSLLWTVIGLLWHFIVCEFAFLPGYYGLWYIVDTYGVQALCLAFIPVMALDALLTVAIIIALKWIILGRRREGSYPIFGQYYWRWWFVSRLEKWVQDAVFTRVADTMIMNVFLRALGASIGRDVRINAASLSDLDLICIHDGARVDREVTLCPARLVGGELHLRKIVVGEGAHLGPRSYVPGGSVVAPSTLLSPMASADKSGAYHSGYGQAQHARPTPYLNCLQLCFGVPLTILVESISEGPVIVAMYGLWLALSAGVVSEKGTNFEEVSSFDFEGMSASMRFRVLYPFFLCIPWLNTFLRGGTYFLLVVLIKWFIVGQFRVGRVRDDWDRFRRWLLERLTMNQTYALFMGLWVNTEVLACCYRLLGARIERKVNMDVFGAVEFDLITVEHDVVFGSSVLLINTFDGESRAITVQRSACVLDHSCVMPGVIVPEGSLLGSTTVAPTDQQLEAMTVYMGCEAGSAVKLFQRPLLPGERIEGTRVIRGSNAHGSSGIGSVPLPMGGSPAALKQRTLEAKAMARHTSFFWFTLFNIWCCASAAVFVPLTDLVYWFTVAVDVELYEWIRHIPGGEVLAVIMIAPIYLAAHLCLILATALLKWVVIGRWPAGDKPYYTWFHFRWAALMNAYHVFHEVADAMAGTCLVVGFMRMMGATVGKRVCFFGHGFEYDLLHIGDEVCIGADCDVTCHTVENMVMKLEEVKFERGSSCMTGSIVMPGGMMEPGSILIEHSQVLKGEVVPQGTSFGGLPARLLRNYPMPPSFAEKESSSSMSVEMASMHEGNNLYYKEQPLLAHESDQWSGEQHQQQFLRNRSRFSWNTWFRWRFASFHRSNDAAEFDRQDSYLVGPA